MRKRRKALEALQSLQTLHIRIRIAILQHSTRTQILRYPDTHIFH